MRKQLYNSLAILMVLVFAAALISPIQAMVSFSYLSREQAKKAGLEIRYRAAGPRDVWVDVSFPTDDKWKTFAQPKPINYVQLSLDSKDDTLGLQAILRESRSTPGRVAVSFTVERTKLHQISVWITRRVTDAADVVRMKDFIELKEIDKHYKVVPLKGDAEGKR